MAEVKEINGKLYAEQIIARAEREIQEETTKEMTEKLKRKMREYTKSKALSDALKREIDAIKLEVKDALGE